MAGHEALNGSAAHRWLTAFVFSSVLSGCAAEYEDASASPEAKPLIGAACVSREPLIIHAVAGASAADRRIDHYTLTTAPGIGGPEIMSSTALPAGRRMLVVGARRCTNCIPENVELIVALPDNPTYAGKIFAGRDLLKEYADCVAVQ